MHAAPEPDPLAPHFPLSFRIASVSTTGREVVVPPLKLPPNALYDQTLFADFATETYEWLSLVRLPSPRIESRDQVDPYLSRYRVPTSGMESPVGEAEGARVCKISWSGFMPSEWVRDCLVNALVAVPSKTWFSMSIGAIHNTVLGDAREITFLRPPDSPGEYFLWDIEPGEL